MARAAAGSGQHFGCVSGIHELSSILFCAQLDPLPDSFIEPEAKVVSRLFVGSPGWITVDFMKNLNI